MTFNLVELTKDRIGDSTLDRIGEATGIDGSKLPIALGAALPGMLDGFAAAAHRPGGAGALADALRAQDDALADGIDGMLADGRANRLSDRGTATLASVLGSGALGKLAAALADFAGIGGNRSGALLGLLAPIVIGAVKRAAGGRDDATALAGLLSEQRPDIAAAMPKEFEAKLHSRGFLDSVAAGDDAAAPEAHPAEPPRTPKAAPARSATAEEPATPAGSATGAMKIVIPVAAFLALAFAGWALLMPGAEPDPADVADRPVDSGDPVAPDASIDSSASADSPAPTGEVSDEAMAAAEAALPEGTSMAQLRGGIDDIFTGTETALAGVTDAASARTALPAVERATTSLERFRGLFERLPEVAKAPLSSTVANGLAGLRSVADEALALPGVEPVLGPALSPMLATLEDIAL